MDELTTLMVRIDQAEKELHWWKGHSEKLETEIQRLKRELYATRGLELVA